MDTTLTLETLAQEANNTIDTSQAQAYKIIWADSVYDQCPPLEFIIKDLMTRVSVNLLVGEGGSKKTWAAIDLAVCLAMGKDWLGFETRQTPVLLIDEESGERRLRRRLFEVLNGHLIKREDAAPIAFTSLNMFDASNQACVSDLQILIEQIGAGLVIIDALADIMPGKDENSVKDVQPVFMNLRRVAEATQAAIIIIHHSNKQTGSYRGSTAIKGAVDLMLMVDSPAASKYITFSVDKSRDIEPRKFTALATFGPGQFYLTATEVNPKAQMSKSQRFVLRYLLEHPNATANEMIDASPYSPSATRSALYTLIDSTDVERTSASKTGRGNKAQYDLTDKGRELAKGEE